MKQFLNEHWERICALPLQETIDNLDDHFNDLDNIGDTSVAVAKERGDIVDSDEETDLRDALTDISHITYMFWQRFKAACAEGATFGNAVPTLRVLGSRDEDEKELTAQAQAEGEPDAAGTVVTEIIQHIAGRYVRIIFETGGDDRTSLVNAAWHQEEEGMEDFALSDALLEEIRPS